MAYSGVVADNADSEVHFHTTSSYYHSMASSSISSLLENAQDHSNDPFDFSIYMDQVSLIILSKSQFADELTGSFDCTIELSLGNGSPIVCQAWCALCRCERCRWTLYVQNILF